MAFGNNAVVRLVHPSNAPYPIEVTLWNDAVVRLEQFWKALEPMLVTVELDAFDMPATPSFISVSLLLTII